MVKTDLNLCLINELFRICNVVKDFTVGRNLQGQGNLQSVITIMPGIAAVVVVVLALAAWVVECSDSCNDQM
jgi:hypothetical protein